MSTLLSRCRGHRTSRRSAYSIAIMAHEACHFAAILWLTLRQRQHCSLAFKTPNISQSNNNVAQSTSASTVMSTLVQETMLCVSSHASNQLHDLSITRLSYPSLSRLEARLMELDAQVSDPKLYDDSKRAGKVVKERAKVESKLDAVKSLTSELHNWREMHGERQAW